MGLYLVHPPHHSRAHLPLGEVLPPRAEVVQVVLPGGMGRKEVTATAEVVEW